MIPLGYLVAFDLDKIMLETFKLGSETLNGNKAYTTAIEDSDTEVISAKTARIKVIGVVNKYTLLHNFSKADKAANRLIEIDINLINYE